MAPLFQRPKKSNLKLALNCVREKLNQRLLWQLHLRSNVTVCEGVACVAMSVRKRGTLPKQANGTTKVNEKIVDAKTDHSRWRLRDDRGRQTWHYLEDDGELKQWPQSVADKHFLGLDTVSPFRFEERFCLSTHCL